MSDILLGQAYFLRFDPKLEKARKPYPPLGTLYAAAVLREAGHSVAVFDAVLADSEEAWGKALDVQRPRLAVLYEDSFNYLSKMCLSRMRQAALAMTRMARARGVPTAVSGSDASDHPEIYLDAGASYVIAGEGEMTLRELAAAQAGGAAFAADAIRGLAWKRADGAIARTPSRPFVQDLDALPLPARDLVDIPRYRRLWRERHGRFSMNLVTTRGCPYHCNWCAKPIYGQRYAVRSPENVVAEIASLRRSFAPDHLTFVDDIFGLQPGWVERFAAAARAAGVVMPFSCLSRADLLHEPVVAALADAGCRSVWIGAESGSQRVLDAMEKGIRVEQVRESTARLHARGIEVGFFLQFGYPGETREDIEKTLALVDECRPDDIGISVAYPLPGTPFFARVEAAMGAKRNWTNSDDLAMMYAGPFGTEFYRALHKVAHKRFRIRKLREELHRASAASVRRRARAHAALAYHRATLPLARLAMQRHARPPRSSLHALPVSLSPEAAAVPSKAESVS